MKKQLEYSEFSFGYAFTENLIRSSATGPSSAPRFPNLVQEGGLGYDVEIDDGGVPVFFQYKLPERMVRPTAREISDHRLDKEGLAVPFFRMYLMKTESSRQHELLIELEKEHAGSVFYAAPFIVGRTAFDHAYAGASVHLQSALFSPREIGSLPGGERHRRGVPPGPQLGMVVLGTGEDRHSSNGLGECGARPGTQGGAETTRRGCRERSQRERVVVEAGGTRWPGGNCARPRPATWTTGRRLGRTGRGRSGGGGRGAIGGARAGAGRFGR